MHLTRQPTHLGTQWKCNAARQTGLRTVRSNRATCTGGARPEWRNGGSSTPTPNPFGPARASELASRLAGGPAFAYSTTKAMLTREQDMSLGSAIEMEAIAQALMMKSEDFGEFYSAWSEGRKPAWSGR